MPAYNAEATIEKSIEAILAQTHQDFELFVVNDGSTDKTFDILKKYIGNPFIDVISRVNGGVSAARNKALALIPNDGIVAYCDADDIWSPEHLETSVKLLLDSGADIVYNNPKIVGISGEALVPTFPLYDSFNGENFKKGNFVYISSVVMRKPSILFDSSVDSLEDFDMWVSLYLAGKKFVQKTEKTITYVVNPNGMARKGINVINVVKDKYRNFFDEEFKDTPIKLHLGCGENYLEGYVNVDMVAKRVDARYDVSVLPYPDNSVDEIFASHVIEHFTFQKGFKVMAEWFRALKPGGVLKLETPDFLESCKAFVKGDEQYRIKLYGHFFAFPEESLYNAHYFLFTPVQLFWQLEQVGFKNIVRKEPISGYYKSGNPAELFLYVEATK